MSLKCAVTNGLIIGVFMLGAATPTFPFTGVFVNGRELSPSEVAVYQRCTSVMPGNYWMDAQGNFGYVGGGVIDNIFRLCQTAGAGGTTTYRRGEWSDVNPDGSSSWGNSTTGDNFVTDGNGGMVCSGNDCSSW